MPRPLSQDSWIGERVEVDDLQRGTDDRAPSRVSPWLVKVFSRPPGIAEIVLVVIVGLAIGGWLASRSRSPEQHSATVASVTTKHTVVTVTAAPTVAPTAVPTVAATAKPTTAPTVAPTVKPVATPAPTPTIAATVAATSAPTAAPAAAAPNAAAAAQGAWRIDEANVQVGTIVWSGAAVASRDNTLALDVHKVSVGGRSAAPCERQTELRATFSMQKLTQTVPYQEVNCQGVSSTGEVRIRSIASNGRSFQGSFWLDGTKLGDFEARATTSP